MGDYLRSKLAIESGIGGFHLSSLTFSNKKGGWVHGCACRKYVRSAENIVKARGLVNHTPAPVTHGCHGKRGEGHYVFHGAERFIWNFFLVHLLRDCAVKQESMLLSWFMRETMSLDILLTIILDMATRSGQPWEQPWGQPAKLKSRVWIIYSPQLLPLLTLYLQISTSSNTRLLVGDKEQCSFPGFSNNKDSKGHKMSPQVYGLPLIIHLSCVRPANTFLQTSCPALVFLLNYKLEKVNSKKEVVWDLGSPEITLSPQPASLGSNLCPLVPLIRCFLNLSLSNSISLVSSPPALDESICSSGPSKYVNPAQTHPTWSTPLLWEGQKRLCAASLQRPVQPYADFCISTQVRACIISLLMEDLLRPILTL